MRPSRAAASGQSRASTFAAQPAPAQGGRGNQAPVLRKLRSKSRNAGNLAYSFPGIKKAASVKLVEYPLWSKLWLRRGCEILPSGRRNTGARAPFGGLLAFRANPLAGPFAEEFFPAFQTVTLLVLILAGRLWLPVIGRGHMSSLVCSDEGGSPGSDAQIRAGLVIYRLLRKISADESNILQINQK